MTTFVKRPTGIIDPLLPAFSLEICRGEQAAWQVFHKSNIFEKEQLIFYRFLIRRMTHHHLLSRTCLENDVSTIDLVVINRFL